jgi:hypothetical protein
MHNNHAAVMAQACLCTPTTACKLQAAALPHLATLTLAVKDVIRGPLEHHVLQRAAVTVGGIISGVHLKDSRIGSSRAGCCGQAGWPCCRGRAICRCCQSLAVCRCCHWDLAVCSCCRSLAICRCCQWHLVVCHCCESLAVCPCCRHLAMCCSVCCTVPCSCIPCAVTKHGICWAPSTGTCCTPCCPSCCVAEHVPCWALGASVCFCRNFKCIAGGRPRCVPCICAAQRAPLQHI